MVEFPDVPHRPDDVGTEVTVARTDRGGLHSTRWTRSRLSVALNEMKFPALSVMVRQYLGIPATSASAERLFSIAGRGYDDLRQNMKEEMLEMLMWARVNREKRHA